LKRTFAAALLMLAAFAAAAAQDAARASSASYSKPTKSGASRSARAKVSAADKSLKADAGDEEVERLFVRNLLAQGGVATFKIKTRITRGRVEMSESPNPGTFESYEKTPRKKLEVLNAPVGQFIDATDGSHSWEQSPWGAAAAIGAGEDGSKEDAPGSRGLTWRKYFSSAKVRGRAVVDGREMVVLDATPRGERPVVMYFDAETWLLRRQDFSPRTPRQENEFKTVVIDRYAEVDGVKVPAVFRQIFTKYTLTFRIYEVKHNVPIDDALFRNPNGR
jgi:hypothetical protein